LNRELIRRDYKFNSPIINDSESDEEVNIEEAKIEDDQLEFSENLQTKSTSPTKRNKVIVKHASVVESCKVTKTNFFTADSNSRTQADEEINESMISCKVDPQEWKNELEKVKPQLILIEKEQYKLEYDPLEEFMMNIEKSLKILQTAKSQTDKGDGLYKKLIKVIDKLDLDLGYIVKEENRMNNK
jgi:hypothetical protein